MKHLHTTSEIDVLNDGQRAIGMINEINNYFNCDFKRKSISKELILEIEKHYRWGSK